MERLVDQNSDLQRSCYRAEIMEKERGSETRLKVVTKASLRRI